MNSVANRPARLNNIIVLRAIATIAVVIFHCYCEWTTAGRFQCPIGSIYEFIFRVVLIGRMPLFVFVSGYLFSHLILDRGKYTTFRGFVKNKFERLLVPFFVFSGILSLLVCVPAAALAEPNGRRI